MSVTYPINLPTAPAPKRVVWQRRNAVEVSESPFSYAQQAYLYGGQIREVTIEYPPMRIDAARQWMGALLSLQGRYGTFILYPSIPELEYKPIGAPLVNGTTEYGSRLATDGWRANTAGVMKAGQWFSIGNRLYQCVQDANSDASGAAELIIWPRLRSTPADNTALELRNPVGEFRLKDEPEFSIDVDYLLGGLTINAQEVI